jgi:ketosteroid isomerase-like protein
MSQENVEVVRRVYEEWGRGNFQTPDVFDPGVKVIWVDPIFVPRAKTVGIRELGRAMSEFLEAFEGITATAERIVGAGDQVVTVVVWRGRGKASGIALDQRQGSVWTFAGGKVIRVVNYRDPRDAFEAAGLSE